MKSNIGAGKVVVGIILSFLILVLSQSCAFSIGNMLMVKGVPTYVAYAVIGILYIGFSYFMIKILCEKILKYKLEKLMITKFRINFKWLCIGILVPMAVTGVYMLLPGELKSNNFDTTKILGAVSTSILMIGLSAGIVEEMVFRGVIMNLLNEKWGKKVAIIVPAIFFAAVHILNGKISFFSAIQLIVVGTLAGCMFSFIAFERKSIWNSAIVHALWNFIMIGQIFNISTDFTEASMYSYKISSKNAMITGGDFGIECSVIAAIAYIIVIIIAYLGAKKQEKTNNKVKVLN